MHTLASQYMFFNINTNDANDLSLLDTLERGFLDETKFKHLKQFWFKTKQAQVNPISASIIGTIMRKLTESMPKLKTCIIEARSISLDDDPAESSTLRSDLERERVCVVQR